MPDRLQVTGVILADQVKSLDWRVRQALFACKVPAEGVAVSAPVWKEA
jgi:mRNA interferase MazF